MKYRYCVIGAIVSVFLVGCQGQVANQPTSTPETVVTPSPSVNPSPSEIADLPQVSTEGLEDVPIAVQRLTSPYTRLLVDFRDAVKNGESTTPFDCSGYEEQGFPDPSHIVVAGYMERGESTKENEYYFVIQHTTDRHGDRKFFTLWSVFVDDRGADSCIYYIGRH